MGSRIDLHVHSTASDGTDPPGQLADKMRESGVRLFALTDHDTAEGAGQLAASPPEGIGFLPGIEFSCRMRTGKCHILGYCCDFDSPAFQAAQREGRELRRAKLEKRLAFLQKECGVCFPEEELALLRRIPGAGRPHLGNLMVKYGYAKSKDEAIERTINLCRTDSSRIAAQTAVRAILASGGIPVWAHPLGGTNEEAISREQFGLMLKELESYGLTGLECYYSGYPLRDCGWLAATARERGLLVSGGSDYHGANKRIAPGTLNTEGKDVPEENLTILGALAGRWKL